MSFNDNEQDNVMSVAGASEADDFGEADERAAPSGGMTGKKKGLMGTLINLTHTTAQPVSSIHLNAKCTKSYSSLKLYFMERTYLRRGIYYIYYSSGFFVKRSFEQSEKRTILSVKT